MFGFKQTIFTLIDWKSQYLFCPVFVLFPHFYCMLYVSKLCKYDLIEKKTKFIKQQIDYGILAWGRYYFFLQFVC